MTRKCEECLREIEDETAHVHMGHVFCEVCYQRIGVQDTPSTSSASSRDAVSTRAPDPSSTSPRQEGRPGGLKSKKWDLVAAKVRFDPEIMRNDARLQLPIFCTTSGSGRFGDRAARVCIRCGEMYSLDACPNCGSEGFSPGYNPEGVPGLFCKECDKGFTYWTCGSCGTKNPISKSLTQEKSGCFVATAACGSSSASEVMALREFRDAHLAHSAIGRTFIRSYYSWSPSAAAFLEANDRLRLCVRRLAIRPLAAVAAWLGRRLGSRSH